MDDMMGKIGELLSDEESMKQLSELAKIMMSEDEEAQPEGEDSPQNDVSSGIDIASLMKITSLIGAASADDKNAELLLALRPHLSPQRQEKVDKMIKLLKLLTIWKLAKESGLIDEIQL